MNNKKSYIPIKVFLSYLVLAVLFASVGWFLYSENKNFSKTEERITEESNTILRVSNLLSDTYETENLARIAIQSESEKDFNNYMKKNMLLKAEIDSLKLFVSTPHQITLLDSVKQLLSKKTINIQQLKLIKNKTENEDAVDDAIGDLTKMESSLRKLELEDFVKDPARMGIYQRNVLQKYVAYLNQNIPDDSTNTLSKKATDSILTVSKNLLNEVKRETSRKKKLLNFEENKLLQNELSISDQLRKVLNTIEREIIINTTKNYSDRENSLAKTNQIVTSAAIIGLLLTLFFLIIILNDYSKTQSYKKQLEEANLKSKKLLISREQLIATVSHDLKTPLSTIIGYTELLGNSDLSSKQCYYTKNIKGSSDYISQLVQDLLDFTQIEAGKITIEKIPFSLYEMIYEVANSIQSVYAQKPIQLIVEIDPNLEKKIIGDPFRLRQIVSNLIGNAFKFTEKGFIKISVEIYLETQLIAIQIEDSGIGIAEKNQELIFEEFIQADKNIEKKYGGTGLGLTISKKMTAILGGALHLKSELGKGSLFTIQIPLLFDVTVSEKQTTANPSKKHYTAILIDDDESLLKLTTEVLKQNQYIVFPFASAKEALDALSNITFDLIITDIQMPVMDGFLFLKELIDNPKYEYEKQPVIAVTGRNDLNLNNYTTAGFTTVISKPYSPNILLKTLQSILNNDAVPFEAILKSKQTKGERPYSLKVLNAFLSNDIVALKEVLLSFIKSTAENLENLDRSVSNIDFMEIKNTAHKMGPMFKQISASEISVILDVLEQEDLTLEEVKMASINLKLKITVLFVLLEKELN
ncbi:hybrid sensor histidine kinase/response regulator [Flavobacterium sp. LS1R10]|uniref:ATP-binding response regulator n=1 Tax=Flavobacterium sp. LS1R10 TaxID=2497482 RepID=UPI000F83D55C|nr:response regulator [Flavobacterium sp. LS1R10]RTY76493.1 response regulator [Flavobacterium sp. LS1R10]